MNRFPTLPPGCTFGTLQILNTIYEKTKGVKWYNTQNNFTNKRAKIIKIICAKKNVKKKTIIYVRFNVTLYKLISSEIVLTFLSHSLNTK